MGPHPIIALESHAVRSLLHAHKITLRYECQSPTFIKGQTPIPLTGADNLVRYPVRFSKLDPSSSHEDAINLSWGTSPRRETSLQDHK